ncbi:MAG: sulfotransferase, partial [Bauldia litoralis]
FVPFEKELHYFDCDWQTTPLAAYVQKFKDGRDQIKGEVTPTYALLPSDRIACIAALKPDIKIVIILRNLVDRSWSQLNHCLKCHEDTFRHHNGSDIDESDMVRHLFSDYGRSENDYIDLLRRWRGHFPTSSIFVDYFEQAVAEPVPFFERLIRFLGGTPPSSWDSIDVHEPHNANDFRLRPPNVESLMTGMYARWEEQISGYVDSEFGLECPWPERQIDDHPWPVRVCDVGERTRIDLDRDRFVAVDIRRGSTVAEHPFLGDLQAALESVETRLERLRITSLPFVRRMFEKRWLASALRGRSANHGLAKRRLDGLIEAINRDRIIFETETGVIAAADNAPDRVP